MGWGLNEAALTRSNMIADFFFDTTWSELAFRQRADDADTQLRKAQDGLRAVIAQVQAQSSAQGPRVQQAAQNLEQARAALENIRRDIMQRNGA